SASVVMVLSSSAFMMCPPCDGLSVVPSRLEEPNRPVGGHERRHRPPQGFRSACQRTMLARGEAPNEPAARWCRAPSMSAVFEADEAVRPGWKLGGLDEGLTRGTRSVQDNEAHLAVDATGCSIRG